MEAYLKEVNFEKYFEHLKKICKGKKIVVYGTGLLFRTVIKNYDLSEFDIIGVSDRKYLPIQEGQEAFGYKIIPRERIVDYKPDIVLLSTQMFLHIMWNMEKNDFKGTKIKVLPLVDKPFFSLLKEVL